VNAEKKFLISISFI